MKDKVLETIKNFGMLRDVKKIVVGVSGGADSTALLHFLKPICKKRKILIVAAHINHRLRGEESDRDEQFVRELCKELNIELFVKSENVRELANKLGQSVEECGRNVRYDYFYSIAEKESSRIAVAHSLSDCIETSLFNLTRGSALRGICGIPPVRDKIIRPFIRVSRQEIEKYCEDFNIKFVTDSSNFDTEYTRNKIRLQVVPALKAVNSNFDHSFLRLIENISVDEEFLENCAERELENSRVPSGFDTFKIRNLNEAIKRRVIFKIVRLFNEKYSAKKHADLLEEVINKKAGGVCINDKKLFIDSHGILTIGPIKNEKISNVSKDSWQYPVQKVNSLTEVKRTFILSKVSFVEYRNFLEKDKNFLYNCLNIDEKLSLEDQVVFRTWRSGDRFAPLNRGVTKTLKKLFNEAKIPVENRKNLVLIASGSEVLWIEGMGISEKCRIYENSDSIYMIEEV